MISAILADWNTLTHSQRMRRAYELGLGAENGPLIDRLEQGDSFARRLAVQTIYGSRDGERALRLTSDPSRLVRLGATRVLCLLGTSEQVLSAFLAGNAAARLRMTRILVKARRREVFDGLCLAAREAGAEWRSFAPFASEAFVTRHFADAFDRAGVQDWARLARHHPRMALEKLLARARAATERDDLLIAQSNGALGALNDRESDLALQLVRELSRHVPLGDLKLAPLLPQKPEEVARLALEAESPVRFNFGPFVSRLKFETLRELILKQPGTLDNPWKWMPHISVAERGNLWAEFGRGWRGSDGVINRALLECLPRDVRDLEARRHVEMPAFAGHPQSWLPYAALLERDTAVL